MKSVKELMEGYPGRRNSGKGKKVVYDIRGPVPPKPTEAPKPEEKKPLVRWTKQKDDGNK